MSEPFTEIYETYKKPIYTYLYRSTYNTHIAEELTHDTFIKAYKNLKHFRGESSLKTWLFTIARNTYLSYQGKSSTKYETINQVHENWKSTDEGVESMIERDSILTILLSLTEKERTFILLRDQHGMSYLEIAEILDEKVGSVRIGIHRARKKFKERYNNEFGGVHK
ncbi:RNA polymerase sigma factor [Pseudalkalibacillus salsuginis]|uniref:RNA polymerase sigma factor n=1 Tax=Pseudalkalibacillus salsuginis TaxID=2910972 RepID=UPI001F3AF1B2|nr:RNA polymerase sigma factor [Pseudalkalibacillus salsuginis]MCF6411489.1 RNA polymerase sigma factor [Pseudalkalibacillus salsuginis]